MPPCDVIVLMDTAQGKSVSILVLVDAALRRGSYVADTTCDIKFQSLF